MTQKHNLAPKYELIHPVIGASFTVREFVLPRFSSPLHVHPEFELTLIMEGAGTRFVGNHVARFGPGDLIFVGPTLPHYWRSDTRHKVARSHSVVVQFGEDGFGKGFLDLPEMQAVRRLLNRARRGLQFQGRQARAVMERLARLPQTSGAVRVTEFAGILAALATIPKPRILSGAGFLDLPETAGATRIRRACQYVFEHLDGEVHLTEAARAAAMSPEAFCRLFRKTTERRFFDFVNELRINHACTLLKDTDRAIGDVAAASGFETLANFNRQFRKRNACTPRDFRRRCR